MKKGAIFDLDGTLLDSLDVWKQIDVDFLAKRGFPVPEDYMEAIAVLSFPKAAEYTIARFALSESPEEIVTEWMDMAREAYAHKVKLKEGAFDFLLELKKRGIRLAVATSCDRQLFLPCLVNNGILELFDVTVTADEAKRGKGFPDVYELAAERMGLSGEECAVFEDVLPAVTGAKMGGFLTIAVFDKCSMADWEKIQAAADKTIEHPGDWEKILSDFT